jgi:hypothetical protein
MEIVVVFFLFLNTEKKAMATNCRHFCHCNTTIKEGKEEGDNISYCCRLLFLYKTPLDSYCRFT